MKRLFFSLLGITIGLVFLLPSFQLMLLDFIENILSKNLNNEFWSNGLFYFGIELSVISFLFLTHSFIKSFKNYSFLFFGTLCLLFFFQLVNSCVNVPINDDYRTILGYVNNWQGSGSTEKTKLFFSFHEECRLIFTRIVVLVFYQFQGKVDFKTILIFSNLCLPAIVLLLKRKVLDSKKSNFILIFSSLLLFQFSFYDASTWLTDAIHYQFLILFVCLFLYFLNAKTKYAPTLALTFAVLACLTFGNGLLVFPLAAFYYFKEKKLKHLIFVLVFGLLFSLFYFTGFNFSGAHLQLNYLWKIPIYSCVFLGSSFQFFQQLYVPFFIGLLIWIVFFILIKRKYYNQNYFVFGLFSFVLLSSVIAGIFRLQFGLEEAISNRYGIFSILIIICSVIALLEIYNGNKINLIMKVALFLAVAFNLSSALFYYPEVPMRKQKLLNYMEGVKGNLDYKSVGPVIPAEADSLIRLSIKNKIYFP